MALGNGEYMGLPAVLSEEFDPLQIEGPLITIMNRHENEKEIWLLGASYNTTSKLESKKSIKCGNDFCYKKSLDENKICKPGTLYFF